MAKAMVLGLGVYMSGCIPIPLLSPPARVSVSGGGVVRSHADTEPNQTTGVEPVILGHAEIDPLQYTGVPADRRLDVGLGIAVLELPDSRDAVGGRWGASLGGRWHLWADDLGEGDARRLSVGGNFDVMIRNEGFGGFGTTATLDFEWASLVDPEPFAAAGGNGGVVGVVFGEIGIGLRATLGYYYLEDDFHLFLFTGGLVFRIPGALGAFLIPVN